MLRTGKKISYHIGIVCVTCPNLLKMDIWTGVMKSLGRTLQRSILLLATVSITSASFFLTVPTLSGATLSFFENSRTLPFGWISWRPHSRTCQTRDRTGWGSREACSMIATAINTRTDIHYRNHHVQFEAFAGPTCRPNLANSGRRATTPY